MKLKEIKQVSKMKTKIDSQLMNLKDNQHRMIKQLDQIRRNNIKISQLNKLLGLIHLTTKFRKKDLLSNLKAELFMKACGLVTF